MVKPSPDEKSVFVASINFEMIPYFSGKISPETFSKTFSYAKIPFGQLKNIFTPSRHHCIPLNGAEFLFMDEFKIFAISKINFLLF
jgi:hypothetical protein